jgi:hypothetical protein
MAGLHNLPEGLLEMVRAVHKEMKKRKRGN